MDDQDCFCGGLLKFSQMLNSVEALLCLETQGRVGSGKLFFGSGSKNLDWTWLGFGPKSSSTTTPTSSSPKSREAKNLPNSKWSTLTLLRRSVTSTIGMAKVSVGLGQTDEEGKKFAKFDDIVEKVNAAKVAPDSSGTYHDYIELLKLYDKNNNGTMMLAELENILANLADPEDEDGMFPYTSFVDRLCGKA